MTVKELAHSAQQHLQARTGGSFKRTHIYELLAASFGFNSYAALSVDTVLTEFRSNDKRDALQSTLIKQRCIELGYRPDTATLAAVTLESFLAERQLGVASISSLTNWLRGGWSDQDDDFEGDQDELFDLADEDGFRPVLLDGLDAAARKGNALAHYALALIHAPDDDPDAANPYWYSQEQQGRILAGVQKEWAEAYVANLAKTEKCVHHLREAGRLGNEDALLDLAEQFDDPSFFEQPRRAVGADPAEVAAIAESLGRAADARHWLTVAAESGDTDAMLQLIEEHDQGDLLRCWTWAYLSQLVGRDLTRDAHYAINEDGSEYDDDVGGPAYVAGRDGIDLKPLSAEQDATARLAARDLFEQLELKAMTQ
ncbi:hypothetical protein [Lysobacter sp. A421]